MIDDRSVRCPERCYCPGIDPQCQDGVPLVMDGCGCCPVCARQQGDVCNAVQLCDVTRKLQCIYVDAFSTSGICRVRRGQGCRVGQSDYKDGDTFKLDCRTQCTCQNGTYGCVSLCPHENVRPSAECHHPRLVKMHGSCCREWLCESTLYEDRKKHCQPFTSEWTACSTTCGMGVSTRVSNANPECQLKNETRLCLLRPCPTEDSPHMAIPHGHHVRYNSQLLHQFTLTHISFPEEPRVQSDSPQHHPHQTDRRRQLHQCRPLPAQVLRLLHQQTLLPPHTDHQQKGPVPVRGRRGRHAHPEGCDVDHEMQLHHGMLEGTTSLNSIHPSTHHSKRAFSRRFKSPYEYILEGISEST
ncbi:CCN family member 1 [Caerostris darwini]|uniref:CCN family member 1 n=1 Tax=Caerostris darwini TaxID=1538125 RepID=A0AAV4RH34_9ARAC|nr:CCN family member 1 [Caerostris darwini]